MIWWRYLLSMCIIVVLLLPGLSADLLRAVERNALAIPVSASLLSHSHPSVEFIQTDFWLANGSRTRYGARDWLLSGLYWWLQDEGAHAISAFRQGDDSAIWWAIAIARAYGQRGDPDSAFSLLNVIDKSTPSVGDIDCVRGALHLAAGDHEKGIAAYERATNARHFLDVECADADSARAALAKIYLDYKMWKAARPYCVELLGSPKHRPVALVGMGQITFRMNPTREGATRAEQYLKTAIAENRRNFMAYLEMADVYRRIGEYSLAESILQQGLEVFQLPERRPRKYIPVQEHRFYILISYGQTLLTEGRTQEAIERLEEAVEIGRFHWKGDVWLARAYLADGQCDKAYQEFDVLLERWPYIEVKDDLEKLERMKQENACR